MEDRLEGERGGTPDPKMDKVTLKRIELLHPKLRGEALEIYKEICRRVNGKVLCRFSHTLRTNKEQDALYAKGRTAAGSIVTNAKGGQSYHNFALAVDIVMLLDKDGNGTYESASWDTALDFDSDEKADWLEAVEVFKSYGWEHGGDWKFQDKPHFQKTYGHSIKELQALPKDEDGYVVFS
tara:strand:- start:1701 stop:2243 length:543 start_codon:yes stop_codon:yes gene_type:complete